VQKKTLIMKKYLIKILWLSYHNKLVYIKEQKQNINIINSLSC